jgi:hypothetical protein
VEITVEISGGFIGRAAGTVRVDTTQLDSTDAARLTSLVHAALFFDQPAHAPGLPGAADYQTYRITVRDGRRSHRIERTDPITDDAIARLLLALQALSPARRQGGT